MSNCNAKLSQLIANYMSTNRKMSIWMVSSIKTHSYNLKCDDWKAPPSSTFSNKYFLSLFDVYISEFMCYAPAYLHYTNFVNLCTSVALVQVQRIIDFLEASYADISKITNQIFTKEQVFIKSWKLITTKIKWFSYFGNLISNLKFRYW